MALTQRQIAYVAGVSQPTISGFIRGMCREESPLGYLDALACTVIAELHELGLTYAVAARLLADKRDLLRFLDCSVENRGWIVFIETDEASYQLVATNADALDAALDHCPLAATLALHAIVGKAKARLEAANV